MFQVPDRLGPLIARIQAGDKITPAEMRNIAKLQALDLAKAGDDFAREMAQRDEQYTREVIGQ